MADALEPRDDFLPDVAALVVVDVRAVEAGLGRERVFAELAAPARDAGFDAQRFQERLVEYATRAVRVGPDVGEVVGSEPTGPAGAAEAIRAMAPGSPRDRARRRQVE